MSRQIKDIISFINSKLNSDFDLERMPKGDAPVDPSEQNSGRLDVYMKKNNLGVLSLMEGNTHIDYELDSGTNKVVGACNYIKENALLIFVYNSGGDHKVIKIDYDNTATTIITSSYLNFQSGYPVKAEMINDEVYYTDGYNEPGMIDLSTPSLLDNALVNIIRLAKETPITSPTLTLSSDTSFLGNNIFNKAYQFVIKFVYWNNQETAWSDVTNVFICNGQESINGIYNDRLTVYNRIQISYSDIPWKLGNPRHVKEIKIGYRYFDIETASPSSWYLYDIIENTSPYTSFDYYFYDNKPVSVLIDVETLYYDIPQKADDLTIIGGNRLLFAGPTKDYDNITLDISLDYARASMNTDGYYSLVYAVASVTSGSNIDRDLIPSADAPYTVIITIINGTTEEHFTVNISIGNDLLDYSYFFIKSVEDSTNISNVVITRNSTNNVKITNNAGSTITVYMEVIDFVNKYETVKAGTYQHLGIEYSDDAGRRSFVQADESTSVYVPYHSEVSAVTTDILCFGINFEISHTPPSWATRWRFVRGESNVSAYFQMPVVCNFTDTGQTEDLIFDGQYIKIDINAADDRILDRNTNYTTLIGFDPQKGDRVRFKSKTSYNNYFTANYKTSYLWTAFTNYIDLEIKEVDVDGNIFLESTVSNSEIDDILGDGSYHVIMIEVYRLRRDVDEEDLTYYHVGEDMPIVNGYHQVNAHPQTTGFWGLTWLDSSGVVITAQNQTAILPAIGVINYFDSYHFISDTFIYIDDLNPAIYTIMLASMESVYNSLSYRSEKQFGKINIINKNVENKKHIGLIYGQTFSEDGLVFNELNKFVTDVVGQNDKYGDITGILQIGYTLNIIQEKKVSTRGVGIRQVSNADGSTDIIASNVIIDNSYELGEDYGCSLKGTIQSKGNSLFYYDIYSGKPIRKSMNGQVDISYGMAKFFEQRSKDLLESGIANIQAASIFDYVTDMYILTVIDSVTSTNSFTLGFSELTNSWVSFFSFLPEYYISFREVRLFSFLNGLAYEHYINSVRCNYYGDQYLPYVTIISNGLEQKVFESIHINSNQKWGSPENDDITIHIDGDTYVDADNYTRHKTKMQSRLKEGKFKFIEGLFKASYLRNMITTSTTPSQKDLIKGDVLRGRYLKQRLTTSETGDVTLREVTINSSISSGN